MGDIVLERIWDEEEVKNSLRKIEFRGLYDKDGNKLKPYANANFSLVKIIPPKTPSDFPIIKKGNESYPLFTAQPTIYEDVIDIMSDVDNFLKEQGKRIFNLNFEIIQYDWKSRGRFHILPPVIERQSYPLKNGIIDTKKILQSFKNSYVKDFKGNLHSLSKELIKDFYIDERTKIDYLSVFNDNLELINYKLGFNGNSDFFLICDGSHRIDYSINYLNEETTAILVEGNDMYPYYALPMPFIPITRLSSKVAENKYSFLARDKIHLFNYHIRKVLHFDWEVGGLNVSKLRSEQKVF